MLGDDRLQYIVLQAENYNLQQGTTQRVQQEVPSISSKDNYGGAKSCKAYEIAHLSHVLGISADVEDTLRLRAFFKHF